MKKFNYLVGSAGVFVLPLFASAQSVDAVTLSGSAFETSILNILNFINTIIIPAIIAVGFLVFVWGMFKFFILGGANEEAKEQGKSLMIYATLGFVLIIVFWGIVNLLTGSTGLDGNTVNNTPTLTVPSGGG